MRSPYAAIVARAHVGIGMREVHGTPIRADEFESLLERHSLEDWLQTIGKLSKTVDGLVPGDPGMDLELARHLGPLSRPAQTRITSGGRFVSPPTLNTVARTALLRSPEGPVSGWDPAGLRDLARALLGANDLFDHRQAQVRNSAEADTAIASVLLRRIARPPAHQRNTIPRIYRLVVDLPQQHPELAKRFDFDAACRDLCGLALTRYFAICLSFFTRFDQAGDPSSWVLTNDYYRTTTVSPQEFQRAIRTVSATAQALRDDYSTEIEQGFASLDDHRPIVRRPICEIRPGAFIPIDFAALAERLVGDGVLWRLRPSSAEAKTRYGEVVGKLLEQHLYEVARAVYTSVGGPDRLYRQKRYGDGKHGPDLAVQDDDAIMVCEIGANVVNVRDTLHRGSIDAFEKDVVNVLLPRIRQLDRKITDLKNGVLAYERPLPATTRIEPVVCLLDGFPLAPVIRDKIDEAINSAGLLKQPGVGRAAILSAEDLEIALATTEKHGYQITDILRGHQTDELRDWPLRDYIRKLVGELPITYLLDREFIRITNSIAAEFSATA